jgi:hypothetical protein
MKYSVILEIETSEAVDLDELSHWIDGTFDNADESMIGNGEVEICVWTLSIKQQEEGEGEPCESQK